ncbi:MAG: sigma 54-interacting transcriptional regulator [Candidatus Margulisiibacteriota bacterium]
MTEKNLLLKRKIKELTALYEISQTLSMSLDIEKSIYGVLEKLDDLLGMKRCTITLLNPGTGELLIEAAYGLTEAEKKRGKYKIGEGITGRVVQSGSAAVVPKIGEDPLFLNKTRSRKDLDKKDISFICVPIKIGKEIIGALSADKVFDPQIPLEEDVRFLSIAASIIGQTVKMQQLIQAEKNQLIEENKTLRQELTEKYSFKNIVGKSNRMKEVYEMIARVAKSDATVLIRGESGTGKELIAHAIHYNSLRTKRPFVKVNMAALPENLVESELFGYERGAFTGAFERKLGRFEMAEGGTLFLDEIGDLSPATQVKLLRVIQEREFERLGGTETIKSNVRLIAATSTNLEEFVKKGRFREDLYYRLNVFPIYLPPLRERKDDVLLIAEHFLAKYSAANHKVIKRISTPAIDALMSYHWPGNVRELENTIERSVLMCEGEVIFAHHLPPTLQTPQSSKTQIGDSLDALVENFEKDLVIDALKSTKGNKTKAAIMLKTTERILGYKVLQYGIDHKKFKF